jgi:hypothetical protein
MRRLFNSDEAQLMLAGAAIALAGMGVGFIYGAISERQRMKGYLDGVTDAVGSTELFSVAPSDAPKTTPQKPKPDLKVIQREEQPLPVLNKVVAFEDLDHAAPVAEINPDVSALEQPTGGADI